MEEEKIHLTDSFTYGSIEREDSSSDGAQTGSEKTSLYSRLFPRGLKADVKPIIQLTWPVTVCQLAIFMMGPISLIMAGHIGDLELAAVALAISVLNITGISVMFGVSSACDTLMSNAYGSINKTLVGVYAQRAFYIMPLCCFPCWALHLNAKNILVLLGQNPQVSELAEYYLLVFSPGLFFCGIHQVVLKYLINQNIVVPNVVVGFISNLGNAGLQYLLVFHFNLGIAGCAIGQAAGFVCLFILTFAYIIISKNYKETWAGLSYKSLEEWGLFMRLAVAGFVMIAMEWWTFEVGIFLSGVLSTIYLSVNSLVFNFESLFYSLPMSFGTAVSVRVGQLLGAGDAIGAKNAGRVTQFLAVCGFIIEALIILSLRNYLPYIFTSNREVAEMVSGVLLMLMVMLGIDSLTAVTCGILRAAGRQRVGALSNLFGYFMMTIPLAVVFMFVLHLGAYGFWYSLIIGLVPICILFVWLQVHFDWTAEAVKAQERVGVDAVSKSVRLDIKSGEFNLRDTGANPPSKGRLVCEKFLISFGFLVTFGAGLTARFLTLSESAFPPNNSTYITNSSFVTPLPLRNITI